MTRLRPHHLLVGAWLTAIAVPAGLSCAPKDEKQPAKPCVPGNEYYCRCPDRSEGQWTCLEDYTFGPCGPCDSYHPYPPGTVPDEPDPPDVDPPASTCGDGVVQEDEDCDDANTDDGDGCSSKCRLAGSTPPASRSCPGLEVHVWGTRKATYTGWTTGSTNTGSASPACSDGGKEVTGDKSVDRVFHVFAHASGTMTIATRATTFDNFLYATEACKDRGKGEGPSTVLACVNATATNGGETLVFPVEAGQDFTVFVDGASPAAGNFTADFSID